MPDVYTLVTDKITAALEAGVVPWQRPWNVPGGLPRNRVSKRPYRGMNRLLLALGEPYASPWWLTFRQAKALGGHVRAGEKATLVTFWKRPEEDPQADPSAGRRAPLLRYYHVFNVAQCEGISDPPLGDIVPTPHERLDWCEQILAGMPHPPEIRAGYDRAFYSPAVDTIGMPRLDFFRTAEDYYATLFHELIHSTGHPTRLDRDSLGTPAPFGSPEYSREELIAELGAAFLCGHAGIFPRVADNQAAYLAGWITRLKGDPRLLPIAASQAQRAADFILGDAAADEEEDPDRLPAPAAGTPGVPAPAVPPHRSDGERVAALILADPAFQAGGDTRARCRAVNTGPGWLYRYQPDPSRPERWVEAVIRLTPAGLDRAYSRACAARAAGALAVPSAQTRAA